MDYKNTPVFMVLFINMTRNLRAKDLLKPPTAITAASFAMVLHGSQHLDTKTGKAEVVIGRIGDVVDGMVARKFEMSTDAGALADVTADKLGMLAIALSTAKHDIVPKPILTAMAIKHITNATATIYNGLTDKKQRSIRPPKSGKYGMAADTISLGAFMLADELEPGSPKYRLARGLGYAAFAAGMVFGAISTRRYLKGDFDEIPAH